MDHDAGRDTGRTVLMGGVAQDAEDRYYADGILMPPKPDYVVLPGGWCVPRDQFIDWTWKETEMPKAKLTAEQELKLALDTRNLLDEKIIELREKAALEKVPPIPRESLGQAFSVTVKFSPKGKPYRYLILRAAQGWYTTSTSPSAKYFDNWSKLVAWLRQGDFVWHSRMVALDVDHGDDALPEWNRV